MSPLGYLFLLESLIPDTSSISHLHCPDIEWYDEVGKLVNLRKGIYLVGTSSLTSSKLQGIIFLGSQFHESHQESRINNILFKYFRHLISTEIEHDVLICIHKVLSKALSRGCGEAIQDDKQLALYIQEFLKKIKGFKIFGTWVQKPFHKLFPGMSSKAWHDHQ